MSDGFSVDAQQIRAHAGKVEAVQERFQAVKAASGAIAQDDAAYGMLCGWMAGILEARHAKQNELYAYVEENLRLAADALVRTSQDYEAVDDAAARRLREAGGRLG
ncbi:type VII secretion target [Actinoplanes sp. URMC 104]|uniref:type VII secretion target n=1 Tax=Actinoplanes sp. URMC 104 TaxID=3423409 RepID=UPI003F1A2706